MQKIFLTNSEMKVIKLKENEYIADMSTLILPFMADYDRIGKNGEDRTINRIEVQQKDNMVIVSGHEKLGVPTLSDKHCFLAIERIFVRQIKEMYGNLVVSKRLEDLTVRERTTRKMTIKEIATEMGYKNPNMGIKSNICDMIRRLTGTTYISQKSKLITKDKDKFLIQAEKGFHLIEEYNIVAYSQQEKEANNKKGARTFDNPESKLLYSQQKENVFDGYVEVTLSPNAYGAMVQDHYLFYYEKDAMRLKNNMARSIYFLTLKWGGKQKCCTVNIKTLESYIVFRYDIAPVYRRRSIKVAMEKIEEAGLGTITALSNGNYVFNYKKDKKKIVQTYMTDKFNSLSELLEGYKALGFKDSELDFIMDNLLFISHYQAILRMVTIKDSYGKIDNPKKYTQALVSDIDNVRGTIDKKYYNKTL